MRPSTIVAAFEAGELAPDAFDHAAHLALATFCAVSLPRAVALDGLRDRLQSFLSRNGVRTTRERGYHETLTRFWFEAVIDIIDAADPMLPRTVDALVPLVHARLGDKGMALKFYSRDRIMSWAARTGWLPPDRRPTSADYPPPTTCVAEVA